jgi:hypothetical protein
LNNDVSILREAIGSIKPSLINIKNDIFIAIDSNQMNHNSDYIINAYNWKQEKVIDCISLFKIDYEIDWSKSTNTLKNNIVENLSSNQLKELDKNRLYEVSRKKIFSKSEKIDSSIIIDLLSKTEDYLNKEGKDIDTKIYNKIIFAIQDLEDLLEVLDNQESVDYDKESKVSVINTLTQILENQIKISDKINSTYLEKK